MNQISLRKIAIITIFKFAFIYSFLLTITICTVAYLNYKAAFESDLSLKVDKLSNDLQISLISQNYPLILRKLGNELQVQEIILATENCKILASSSLLKDCPLRKSDFILKKISINGLPLLVFYKIPFSAYSFLKIRLHSFSFLFLSLLTITFIILFFLFNFSLLKALNIISKTIEEPLLLPKELGFVSDKIMSLKKNIASIEKDIIYYNLARRVVHDIRNPLHYIKYIAEKDLSHLPIIKEKILEIEYQVQSLLKPQKDKKIYVVNVTKILTSISTQFEETHGVKVQINSNKSLTYLSLNDHDLSNIVANLIRNSCEAEATEIFIHTNILEGEFILSLSDNGKGITGSNKSSIFERASTKKNGNGIGLKSIKKLLQEIGGSINLKESSAAGTVFELTFPLFSNSFVLIDDDKYLRTSWIETSKKLPIHLFTYESIQDFLKDAHRHREDVNIYIDSVLGELRGEKESQTIYKLGFKNISITTSMPDLEISGYFWIKNVVSKEPQFST